MAAATSLLSEKLCLSFIMTLSHYFNFAKFNDTKSFACHVKQLNSSCLAASIILPKWPPLVCS
jgi:hypothetical protein